MEFRNPLEECSDDDETLSFCDLVTEQGVEQFALRDSNAGSLDHEGFGFDFEFDRCGSTTDHLFPADYVFRHGRLLPLALQRCPRESVQYCSLEKPMWQNLLAWRNDSMYSQSSLLSTSRSTSSSSQRETDSGEILRRCSSKSKPALTWRNDSLDSQSRVWWTSTSTQRKSHSGDILRLSNSKSKGNYKPAAAGGKMSAKCRSLPLGLMKTPPIKLEDMRHRQGKTKSNINGAKNYFKELKLEEKEAKVVNFQDNCKSGKDNCKSGKENVVTPWLKGWKMLARCPLLNSCKISSNSVVENSRLQKACKI